MNPVKMTTNRVLLPGLQNLPFRIVFSEFGLSELNRHDLGSNFIPLKRMI